MYHFSFLSSEWPIAYQSSLVVCVVPELLEEFVTLFDAFLHLRVAPEIWMTSPTDLRLKSSNDVEERLFENNQY